MSGGIFMTQFFGAKDQDGMQQAFRFKLAIGLLAFIPYFLVCIVFPREVLSLMLVGNTQAGPILDEGAAVTTSRNDIDYVVTEYGIAALKGLSLRTRARNLIEIAHPDFRDGLIKEAQERRIWRRSNKR